MCGIWLRYLQNAKIHEPSCKTTRLTNTNPKLLATSYSWRIDWRQGLLHTLFPSGQQDVLRSFNTSGRIRSALLSGRRLNEWLLVLTSFDIFSGSSSEDESIKEQSSLQQSDSLLLRDRSWADCAERLSGEVSSWSGPRVILIAWLEEAHASSLSAKVVLLAFLLY